jgi:branched-chain amino acid transport system permease protein/neutral amino acid transport system permease protein
VSSGPIVAAVVSLSIGIILESSIRFIFGTRLHGLDIPILPDYRVGGIRVGDQQVDSLVFVTVAMALLWLMLRYTRAGRAMRAFADNASLARLKGVNASAMVTMVVFTGSGLAGIGGLLAGAQGALDPQLGARLLVSIFAASVLGGLGSVPGALLGALVIGVAEEMSVWLIAPAYRTVASFLIILLVLSLRPSGLLGKRG